MKPCKYCGTPIGNAESSCVACVDACDAKTSHDAVSVTGQRTVNVAELSSPIDAHWSWVFAGGLLRGIPVATIMVIASQVVSSFRMPILTSCLIGLGVLGAFSLLGGLADLLPTGANKSE